VFAFARIEAASVALARRIAFAAVAGMLLLAGATIADVTLRAAFNAPITGFLEVAVLVLAVGLAACFPAGMAERRHIAVDLLEKHLGPRRSAILTALGAILMFAFVAFLGWRMGIFASQQFARNAVTMTIRMPTWPYWWAAFAFLAVAVPVGFVALAGDARSAWAARRAERKGGAWIDLVSYGAVIVCIALCVWALVEGREAARMMPGGRIGLAILFFAAMSALTMLLTPLSAAMGITGIAGAAGVIGLGPALSGFGTQTADLFRSFEIAVIPLFLMMGSFAATAGLGHDVYRLAFSLFGHFKGGVAMATICGCAGFGAVTGSSIATIATVGPIALPEMRARGYSSRLSSGSIAAGGTLGALLPPSGTIVLFALLTDASIAHLFVGALIPAALAVLGYLAAIWWETWRRPDSAPEGPRAPAREVLAATSRCGVAFALFALVVGGLYFGVFTPTEAAAVGAGAAFVACWARGKLNRGAFWHVMGETAGTTAMIYMLIVSGMMFSFFIGLTQLPDAIVIYAKTLDIAPLLLISGLLAIYIVLGTVMESYAIMVVTVPVITPLVLGFGYDLVWWGIVNVVVVEIGVLTPPVGINLFVIKSIMPDIPLATVFKGVGTFVTASIVKLILIVLIPALVTFLPRTMH
jgi:tripartite ATP-independent transporter DctM subunit